ncbi:DUF3131 domain-containing protein [Nostoc favosum]|uniref:DUF3131 domain-containing protein n=1 Tax=Nostoc favosum CHAB5714 TaxID=2780399 RepID=A0ABS8IFR1_9NOSO|nr:DUF3131 domain-containing protein [Nostoc favosum]MCC5603042.1 DUF3131 domain-containing protein [Nostoc favosum CHAB5714]
MNKVRLALMMLILLGSIFASKNLIAIADASKQVENRKLNQIRNQTTSNTPVLLGLYALPATGLPNKAYSTRTAQMRQLNHTPDPKGTSGWSALDMARFLLGLHVMRSHYPEYSDHINRIVALTTAYAIFKLCCNSYSNARINSEIHSCVGVFSTRREARRRFV